MGGADEGKDEGVRGALELTSTPVWRRRGLPPPRRVSRCERRRKLPVRRSGSELLPFVEEYRGFVAA